MEKMNVIKQSWKEASHGIGHKGEKLAVTCESPPDLTHCGTDWTTSPVDFLLYSLPASSLPVTDFVNTVTLVTAMPARHVTRTPEGQSSFCHCRTSDLPGTKTHAAWYGCTLMLYPCLSRSQSPVASSLRRTSFILMESLEESALHLDYNWHIFWVQGCLLCSLHLS